MYIISYTCIIYPALIDCYFCLFCEKVCEFNVYYNHLLICCFLMFTVYMVSLVPILSFVIKHKQLHKSKSLDVIMSHMIIKLAAHRYRQAVDSVALTASNICY